MFDVLIILFMNLTVLSKIIKMMYAVNYVIIVSIALNLIPEGAWSGYGVEFANFGTPS